MGSNTLAATPRSVSETMGKSSSLTASCWETICGASIKNLSNSNRYLSASFSCYDKSGTNIGGRSNKGEKAHGSGVSATMSTTVSYETKGFGSIYNGTSATSGIYESLNCSASR